MVTVAVLRIDRCEEVVGQSIMSISALAMHLNIREFLADDKMARVAARMSGLMSIGCLGVVMKAYETEIITRNDAVESIQRLVKAGLWISPEVLAEVFTAMK